MRFGIQGEVPVDAPGILSPWPLGSMLLSSNFLVQGWEVHFDRTGRVSSATQRLQRAKLLHVHVILMGLRRPPNACGPHCICFLSVNVGKTWTTAGGRRQSAR